MSNKPFDNSIGLEVEDTEFINEGRSNSDGPNKTHPKTMLRPNPSLFIYFLGPLLERRLGIAQYLRVQQVA